MNFIIIGSGRVGAELAYHLYKGGHQVVVVDTNKAAFNRLHPDFRGRTTEGDVLASDTLERAGVDKADGVAVATNSDTLNAVIGHTVRSHYPNVKQVVVRNYDPHMRGMLEAFGLQIVSSTAWGAERLQELLTDTSYRAVFSAGNGEVEIYEMLIPQSWAGREIVSLMKVCPESVFVALTRAGRAFLPLEITKMEQGDIVTVGTKLEGIEKMRLQLEKGPEG
jgi:trk system potassium uptake protein TrkA